MATLDVSFVLDLDLFRHDDLWLLKRAAEPLDDGSTSTLSGWIGFSGTVKPATGQDLIQTGEGDAVSADILIYTRTALSVGDDQTEADCVAWSGAAYTVVKAQPYRFGSGYVRAMCRMIPINPSAMGEFDGAGG